MRQYYDGQKVGARVESCMVHALVSFPAKDIDFKWLCSYSDGTHIKSERTC